MRAVLLHVVLAACLVPASVRAQSLVLTESEALARLSVDSPRVRAIRAALDVARVDVASAGRWPNPRVNWDRQSVAGVTEHLVTVSQPLPITGRRGLDVQAASARVAASSNRVDDESRRLRADLRLAFAELQAAQIRERELTGARDRLRELAEVLAKREAAGDAAGFDRLRAEREVLDGEADQVVAATERAQAQATLATFFADVTDPSLIVAGGRSRPPSTWPRPSPRRSSWCTRPTAGCGEPSRSEPVRKTARSRPSRRGPRNDHAPPRLRGRRDATRDRPAWTGALWPSASGRLPPLRAGRLFEHPSGSIAVARIAGNQAICAETVTTREESGSWASSGG